MCVLSLLNGVEVKMKHLAFDFLFDKIPFLADGIKRADQICLCFPNN